MSWCECYFPSIDWSVPLYIIFRFLVFKIKFIIIHLPSYYYCLNIFVMYLYVHVIYSTYTFQNSVFITFTARVVNLSLLQDHWRCLQITFYLNIIFIANIKKDNNGSINRYSKSNGSNNILCLCWILLYSIQFRKWNTSVFLYVLFLTR